MSSDEGAESQVFCGTTAITQVLADLAGTIPRTSGCNQFLLTIMHTTTRYPNAIPISAKLKPVVK